MTHSSPFSELNWDAALDICGHQVITAQPLASIEERLLSKVTLSSALDSLGLVSWGWFACSCLKFSSLPCVYAVNCLRVSSYCGPDKGSSKYSTSVNNLCSINTHQCISNQSENELRYLSRKHPIQHIFMVIWELKVDAPSLTITVPMDASTTWMATEAALHITTYNSPPILLQKHLFICLIVIDHISSFPSHGQDLDWART